MESFRTEIEDPIVQNEIIDLEEKIALFKMAKLMMSVFVVCV
jgi:sulfite reductase (ferredoxin)